MNLERDNIQILDTGKILASLTFIGFPVSNYQLSLLCINIMLEYLLSSTLF
jgi:hypothetical protein